MSRTNRNIGILLAVGCGVLVSYSTLRPELEKQKAERLGLPLPSDRKDYDTVLSDQMRDDFREAGRELRNEGGFAWGIRQKLFGRDPNVMVVKEGGDREKKQENAGEGGKTEEKKG